MTDIRYLDYAGNALAASGTPSQTFDGTSGSDTLVGTGGNDLLRGNGAAIYASNKALDRLVGGLGDDTYYVSSTRSIVLEGADEGIDTVRATANFVLPDEVENLVVNGFTGYSGTTGVGNAKANVVIGDALAQILDARAGNDVITGGGGGDTFILQKGSGRDVITDFFAGTKAAKVSLQDYDFKSFDDIKAKMAQVGGDVVLTLSDQDSVTFRNATIDKFTSANFTLPLDLAGMKLTFSDEFNKPLDLFDYTKGTGTWLTSYGWGGDPDGRVSRSLGSVNGERQIYVDPDYQGTGSGQPKLNPFAVHDGVLDITATPMPDSLKSSMYGYDYYSGLLTTRGSFTQTYGYFEARMKMPTAEGSWSGLWMFGSSGTDPSEIDVAESAGSTPGVIKTVIHDSSLEKYDSAANTFYIPDASTAFHNYGVKWDADHVTYYLDGREVYQIDTPDNLNRPMYVLLNLAVGASGGKPDPAQYPDKIAIDYIRAYSLPSTETSDAPSDLVGAATADILRSSVSTKTMAGFGGDDVYYVDHPDVLVTEAANGGRDTVVTSLLSYALAENVENLTYSGSFAFIGTGNAGNNTIIGGSDGDRLNGGAGIDTLIGGAGGDIYFVDNQKDVVIEAVDAGYDIVYSSATSYKLADGQQIEALVGSGPAVYALTGNEYVNRLVGTGSANRLDGGAGPDTMEGRGGNDRYVVDDAGDRVIERDNDGWDTVETALSTYALPQNVEVLIYTGTGNFTGVGNAQTNSITGGIGNDVLNGGGGADVLAGGLGNDVYVVGNSGITIIEKAGEGFDTMFVTTDIASASANIELMTYRGSGNFRGFANAQGTQIVGGAGNDTLVGGAGNDVLDGRGGTNVLSGGGGADKFVINEPGLGVARILDFVSGDDHLALDASTFKITSLDDLRFILDGTSDGYDGHPAFVYNASGSLFFNASGDPAGASVLVATFDTKPVLHAYDFMLS